MSEYNDFLEYKLNLGGNHGFEPTFIPDWLFPFQKDIVRWNTLKGRSGTFADTGLGKTPMQLVWAQNVIEHTNKPVLILTPLAVSGQTLREADKFNIEAHRSREGKTEKGNTIYVSNYERLHYFNPDDFGGVVCDECHGSSMDEHTETAIPDKPHPHCPVCKGTKIDPNKNIGELLMLIVSELGEALEAHRCGKFADWAMYDEVIDLLKNNPAYKTLPSDLFKRDIKSTFEDEIADVFIRLFDLCGYLGIKPEIVHFSVIDRTVTNVSEMLFIVTKEIVKISDHHQGVSIESSLDLLDSLCTKLNIPIEKHIKAKMAYNRTRPHKHGKEY